MELWIPGCGRPHPDAELIKDWADGKVAFIETTRRGTNGVSYTQQFPCWNPNSSTYKVKPVEYNYLKGRPNFNRTSAQTKQPQLAL